MNIMIAFGIASIMLLLGMFLRAKVRFLQNLLLPSSIIAGIAGLLLLNAAEAFSIPLGVETNDFSSIVNPLFVIAFISITLMGHSEEDSQGGTKSMLKGALAIGLIWCLLFTLTPLISAILSLLFEKNFHFEPIYSMLIPFGFCMGPGQSVTYGSIIESYGWNDAVMVGLTFSSIGFFAAYLVGIPAAKRGIKRGLAKHSDKIDEEVLRGYFRKHEQVDQMKKSTTCSSNIETMSFHFAVIGLCYIIAVGISKILALLPGYIGASMSSLMFLNGMYAAWIVKFVMKKWKLTFLLDDDMQNKITGWSTDFLIVCSLMSVSLKIVGKWMISIVAVSAVVTVVSALLCFYFGQRIGTSDDFEKTLGLYGMSTGTAPSGLSLIRIVDPNFKTMAAVELGASNPVCNICNIPTYLLILGYAEGSISFEITLWGLFGLSVVLLLSLKVTKCWGKKRTFRLFGPPGKN